MNKVILIAVLALSGLVGFGTAVQAAEQGGGGRGQGQGERGNRQDRLETMKQQLNLTDTQVAKLKPVLEENGKKVREIMQDSSLTREQRRAKVTSLRDGFQAQIKAVLTKEQFEKYEKMNQERQQRRERPPQGQ